MELDIKEMIDGPPARLRHVFRYSTSRVNFPESTAEHSYYVCLYAMLVGEWVNVHYKKANNSGLPTVCMANLLQRAIVHDLEEAVSGDFPRPFKHSTPELKQMLELAAERAIFQVLNPVIKGVVLKDMVDTWHYAKDNTLEGQILEFCDFLSVLGFMMQESGGSGNKVLERHVGDMGAYFSKFIGPDYEFIRPLVVQAKKLMDVMFPLENH